MQLERERERERERVRLHTSVRNASCEGLPISWAITWMILSSFSCTSFSIARSCCILHSAVLVIPLLTVRWRSFTMCGTAATVVSSSSLAIFPSSQPKKTPTIYSFEFDKSRNLQKLQKLQFPWSRKSSMKTSRGSDPIRSDLQCCVATREPQDLQRPLKLPKRLTIKKLQTRPPRGWWWWW